jgi:uncharacterized protein (DUF2235 family)
MGKRIVLLFDGTWNNKEDRTNVTRMKECLDSTGEDDPRQPFFYDSGVGTHWYDKFTGGAFGRGLSINIRQGYQWLSRKHVDGDEIFVFGFSRGAYTARSLVGLIRKCGLLNSPTEDLVGKAYDLYRDKNLHPDSDETRAFRAKFSREVRVKFIGVWDTVGALGIPVSHVPFSRDYYRWHDTELSKIVDFAYHAVAVDEHREDYQVTLWSKTKPENKDVEQRWFIGAHSNVGGGYDNDPLPNLSMSWLQRKAASCGLGFSAKVNAGAEDHLAKVTDSFASFFFGLYRLFKQRRHRPLGTGANETVDESVWRRWKADAKYRPVSLSQHPDKPGD